VLQHPAELKRKNRSIPVLQLSVHPDSFLVALGRRLGDKISPELMAIVRDNTEPLLLLFPGPEAIGLDEALEKFQARDEDKRINVLVLDATWKYVREMDRANAPYYPPHMIRVQLKPTDDVPNFSPGRFDIRTPPSQDHLSTAECMAWVASRVERDESLYESLLAPLDYMVAKWKSFSEQEEDKRRHNNDEDDNKPSTSSPDRQRGSKRKKAVNIENTRCNDILN
jgi:DTW domain-containing protein YfiP